MITDFKGRNRVSRYHSLNLPHWQGGIWAMIREVFGHEQSSTRGLGGFVPPLRQGGRQS